MCVYVDTCVFVHMYVYIYIYIYRERERNMCVCIMYNTIVVSMLHYNSIYYNITLHCMIA